MRHLPSRLADLIGRDISTVDLCDHALAGLAHEISAKAAGDERNYHRRTNDQEHAAEYDLLGRSRGLQKSNHLLITPKVEAELFIINHSAGHDRRKSSTTGDTEDTG